MVYYHGYGTVKRKLTITTLLVIAGLFTLMVTLGVFTNAKAAPTTNLTLRPSDGILNVDGVQGDYPTADFASGSIASKGTSKTEIYLTPQILFGKEVKIDDIASMSYWTKKGTTHLVDTRDWYLAIYTKPYVGDVSTPGWYGDRYGTEPYSSKDINAPANQWNNWTTGGVSNQLRFFESTHGASGANFGTYADPAWADFVVANALSNQARSTQDLLYISVQTASGWVSGFTGQLDGLKVTLKDGSVANVNFEANAPKDKDECKKEGWQTFGFKNQGLCIQYVNTGKDNR